MEYRHLFTELKIGARTLRNRICMPAMHMGYEESGEVTDREVEFYRARAKGGAALIVVGGCSIDEPGGGALMIGLYDDRFLPGLERLAGAIRGEGALAAAQLFHSGRYSYSYLFGIEPVAPSAVPSRLTRVTPRELTKPEIAGIVKSYGDAAGRAAKAGFDVVEVIGSAGYLLTQFISPLTNKRKDEYGGPFENRMRFPLEVLSEVKRRVAGRCAVMVRVAGNDFMGLHENRDEVLKVVKLYEETGAQALSVTGGWHESRVPQITGHLPRGGYAYLARDIREVVGIPVIASNRMGDPRVAEEALRLGFADAINMARPLLADPELPNKAREGRESEIRPCISCNQECLDNVFMGMPTLCTVNAACGAEAEFVFRKAANPKKVAVAGGGPGGCEAARAAAMRGHDVTLLELSGRLGGQIHDACVAPGKDVYRGLAVFHEAELKRLGVKVRLGTPASEPLLVKENFDAVIVATGSSQVRPPIKGADRPHVVFARDVLERKRDWTEDVVIIGAGGVGLDTAHLIADCDTVSGEMVKFLMANDAEPLETLRRLTASARRRITLVDMLEKAGKDVGKSTKWVILQDLKRLGVSFVLGARVAEIGPDTVTVEAGGETRRIPATTVILAAGARSDNELAAACKGKFADVITVGDAVAPRNITSAIREGTAAGMKV
jgi:2,4-dienoyl-CoA reductase (NADPH2)